MNEDSSCWIHVSQPWSGAGYGVTNLPRIGHEVIVDFLGGDPDRPIIVGRVYTNLQKTPYALPANKTQSGWKSNSTNGTGGYNEIMFEDSAGKELFRVQAERDFHALVKHDAEIIVGRDVTTFVKRNDSLTVDKDLSKHVLGNEREVTAQNRAVSVGQSRTTNIGVNETVVVGSRVATVVPPAGGGSGKGTSTSITDDKIVLSTKSGATVTLSGTDISLSGANVSISASQKLTLSGKSLTDMSGGTVKITGGPMVLINPSGGLFSARVTDPSPNVILKGAATVLVGGPQFPFDVVRLPNGDLQVGKAITIKGDANFQGAVMSNLGKMSTTPAGMHVLNVIDGSGKTMTVIPFNGNNSFCGPNTTWADFQGQTPAGQPVYDGAGKPIMGPDGKPLMGTGTGANTTLQLNPNLTLPNSQDPSNPMPNDAIMFHEMTHGTHQMTGTADMSPVPGWDTKEEQTTISTGNPSEADYLQQTGYPYHRTDHDTTWAPNGP
jgi:type VI secretion system secreted protein VgrG